MRVPSRRGWIRGRAMDDRAPGDALDAVAASEEMRAEEDTGRVAHPRRRLVIGIAAVALLAVLGGVAAVVVPSLTQPRDEESTQRVHTATDVVSRGDIAERVRTAGKLGYGNSRPLRSTLTGTVTSVPAVGTVIGRGEELFRIDDQPVALLFGVLPAWRGFSTGMSNGRDVRQFEENLRDLGLSSPGFGRGSVRPVPSR
ncbi:hypothetical protein ABMA10_07415 [Plantibacter sp. RU18]